jgi:hypothetical protein
MHESSLNHPSDLNELEKNLFINAETTIVNNRSAINPTMVTMY